MPDIGSGQKAALWEAYGASVLLLPPPLRSQFVLVGGASLVILGGRRETGDVDFAVSGPALAAFDEAATKDPRFSKGSIADWKYICNGDHTQDLEVALEFLQQGGSFAPSIKVVKPVGDGFRASLGELARMKANAYMAREEPRDQKDFCFLLEKMEDMAEGFEGMELEAEDREDMEATAAEAGETYTEILKKFLKKAGL